MGWCSCAVSRFPAAGLWKPERNVPEILDRRNVCLGGTVHGGVFPSTVNIEPTNAKMIAAGCNDGSIQVFFKKDRYLKPDRTIREAGHGAEVR